MDLEKKIKNFTKYFLKIAIHSKLLLNGDRELFKLIKYLKFYNNFSRK